MKGDAGARVLLRFAKGVELMGGELDIDTADDLAQAQRLWSGQTAQWRAEE
jgi:CTP:molybdopterin cytidylyltransferase MocA